MRYPVLACLALSFWSCALDYEDNERLLITGAVTKASNDAFPGLPVEVSASDFDGRFAATGRLGVGAVEPDGSYTIVALSPKDARFQELLINNIDQNGYDANYSSHLIRGLETLDSDDFTFTVPEIRIDRLRNAFLEVKRVDNMTDSLDYSYTYKNINAIIDLSEPATAMENDIQNILFGAGLVAPDELNQITELVRLIENDTLNFEYRLINGDTLQTGNTQLLFNPETNNYVFEF